MSEAAKVIAIAKAEVGYREGYSNGRYNNKNKYSPEVPGLEWSDYQPWCQTFQSWVFMKAGLSDLVPRTASCLMAVSWFKQRGRFSYYPAIGAQVFYGSNGGAHVGLVYKYDETYVYTIEGNTNDSGSAEGNGVYLKKRRRRDSYVYGYGLPAFSEGITTADPGLKGKSGYHYKASATAPESHSRTSGSSLGIKGIDVSSYQSEDYSLSGIDFVVVKATEGTHYVNPKHAAQAQRARNAGLVVGHYHFLRDGDVRAQVDFFLKHAKPRQGEFLALDWEDPKVSNAEKDDALKYLKSKAGGRKVLLYCNTEYWLKRDKTSECGDGLWIAHYGSGAGNPPIEHPWLIHQFTDNPMDTNVTRWRTRADMANWAGAAIPRSTRGDEDMPEYVSLSCRKEFDLKPNKWDAVEFDVEHKDEPGMHSEGGSQFVRGPARFTGEVTFELEGVEPGVTVQARLSEVKDGEYVVNHPVDEQVGTEGKTYYKFPFTGRVGRDRGVRVRVCHFNRTTIKVRSVVLKALVWKE